jgi:hypothetical protein
VDDHRAQIPDTHGVCCLDTSVNSVPTAGLDLRPELIGARGVELLIAQLHRNEYGPPEVPSNTTIVAAWKEGPTLRRQKTTARPQAEIRLLKAPLPLPSSHRFTNPKSPALKPHFQPSRPLSSAPLPPIDSLRTDSLPDPISGRATDSGEGSLIPDLPLTF